MSKDKEKKTEAVNQQPLKQEAPKDPNVFQVVPGNTSLLTVKLLDSINQNLVSLIAYLKHRDLEKGK